MSQADTGSTPPTNAAEALSQTMAYYKHSMTGMEANGWVRIIGEFGDRAVMTFLEEHMQSSTFAPKFSEALKLFAPSRKNSVAAYEELSRAVRECGPYAAPRFEDPALPRAVKLMGGWLAVNEQLPAENGSFEGSAFIKRFDAMYAQACSDVLLQREVDSKLRGLHDLTKPAGLLEHSAAATQAPALQSLSDARKPIDGGDVIERQEVQRPLNLRQRA